MAYMYPCGPFSTVGAANSANIPTRTHNVVIDAWRFLDYGRSFDRSKHKNQAYTQR